MGPPLGCAWSGDGAVVGSGSDGAVIPSNLGNGPPAEVEISRQLQRSTTTSLTLQGKLRRH